jgi:hypothetical protein
LRCWPISGGNLTRKSSLGHAYAVAGKFSQAWSILAALRAAAAGRRGHRGSARALRMAGKCLS